MIVDCHTQIWDASTRLGRGGYALVTGTVHADAERHLQAAIPVDRAIVLAFKSRYLGAEIPNSYVADYVRRNPAKMVGFAGIDPTEPDWLEELRVAQEDLQLKGVAVSPASQDFHPSDTRAMRLYEQCLQRSLPVVFEQNRRSPAAKLEFDRPLLLDEVAREFPELRIVVAHMGYPWVHETVTLLGKHPHVFADVAGLLRHPWLAYNALLAAYEYGVMDKLLFGSGFPFRSPAGAIETLYSINQISYGTNLIAIPREQLRGIVERDALSLLGIAQEPARAPRAGTIIENE
jgi:predicted TIM-barrel fold metal-dependent hydrolase